MKSLALALALGAVAGAFYGGFRLGHYTRADIATLQRCIADYNVAIKAYDDAIELLQELRPAPPAAPISVPALDYTQEGEIV